MKTPQLPPTDPSAAEPATTFRDDLAPNTCPTCHQAPKTVGFGTFTCAAGHTWTLQERGVKAR